MTIKGNHRLIYLKRKKNIKKQTIIPDKEFLAKYIWITNKEAERQLFSINEIQDVIESKIIELQKQGIPPKILILKARQMGVSTYSQGKMVSNTSQKMDKVGLIVAHTDKSVKSIFKKAKFMVDNLDEDIKPLQKASNAKELIFDLPSHYKGDGKGLNSSITVQVAGDENIGRGDTIHYCHASEFAFWKGRDGNSPKSQLSAIAQAIPKHPDTWFIIESTAKGFNDFKDLWDEAVRGENGWFPLFFAWHKMREYQIPFKHEEEKQNFIDTMDPYEKEIKSNFDLTYEQLNWYRETKRVNCNNNYDKMKQENPSFPEEAFLFTGFPVFNNNIVMERINELKKEYINNPYIIGLFSLEMYQNKPDVNTIRFNINRHDNVEVRIYEKPRKGFPYCIGADTKGEGKDFYTATIINCMTQDTVCTIKADLTNSLPFSKQLYCAGLYYNNALIGVEMNFNTAPIEKLKEWQYTRQYKRKVYDSKTKKKMDKLGWKTDGITRPLIIDKEVNFVENHISCLKDIETLQEMLTFVKDENGRPDAMSGKHDDLLFSDMIAREIQSQISRIIDEEKNRGICIIFGEKKEDKYNNNVWEVF